MTLPVVWALRSEGQGVNLPSRSHRGDFSHQLPAHQKSTTEAEPTVFLVTMCQCRQAPLQKKWRLEALRPGLQ